MKVLVTGASGFVGAHSAVAVADDGHELRLLVRNRDKAMRVAAAVGLDGVELVDGDVTDRDSVRRALAGCDAVLHAAGAVSVERKHAAESLAVNTAGAEHVLRAAADLGLDLIVHVSSTSALAIGTRPIAVDAAVSDAPGYAASKASAERIARALQADGAPVHITYPAGIIGPAAGEALGETSKGMAAFVAGGLLPTRRAALSVIDVRDVAAVHQRLLSPARHPHPARVMCGGALLTMQDLQREVSALTGRRFPIAPVPPAALRGVGRLADRLAAHLPIEPSLTEEGMTLITTWPGTADNVAELGVDYRPLANTLADALDAWCAAGLITARQRGAPTRR